MFKAITAQQFNSFKLNLKIAWSRIPNAEIFLLQDMNMNDTQ